jgi:dipeptidase
MALGPIFQHLLVLRENKDRQGQKDLRAPKEIRDHKAFKAQKALRDQQVHQESLPKKKKHSY